MRCALYLRVSSKKQLDGVSLDDQEHLGRTHAERMGWTVTHVFKEMGQSAFKEDLRKRAAFQQLLDEAQRRSFDVVLVYKLNRFARNVPAQYQAAAELERYGVRIASVTEPVERQTASGRATFGMLAVMAQLQSDQLSEKMRDTRLAEARQGRLVGPVPVGYRRDDLGCVVPSSGAEAVREAFRLYATGEYSVQRITAALNEAGHVMPDGGPFKVTGVEEMLKSPIYAGYVICGDKTFPAKHEPLIDQETWDRTREVQVERGRRRTGPPKRHDPLLAGFMVCPGCGASMWHNLSGSKRYYRCSAYTTQGSPPTPGLACLGHRAYAETVEQATMAWVAGLALTPDLLSQAQGMMSAPKRRVARPVDIDQSLKRPHCMTCRNMAV